MKYSKNEGKEVTVLWVMLYLLTYQHHSVEGSRNPQGMPGQWCNG